MKAIVKKYCMRNRIGVDHLVDMLVQSAYQKNAKSLARVVYNLINKDKIYLMPDEVNSFLIDDCHLPHNIVRNNADNRRGSPTKKRRSNKIKKSGQSEDDQGRSINPSLLSKVVDTIKAFFTTARKVDPLDQEIAQF